MSLGRHVCRQASQLPLPPLCDHVWISDEILARTFQRFASHQRRHGSCVPGPLEARRRLAKRRNTELARNAPQGPLTDVGAWFGKDGLGHRQLYWNEPASPLTDGGPIVPGVFPPPPPPEPTFTDHRAVPNFESRYPDAPYVKPPDISQAVLDQIVEARVAKANTLAEMREVVEELGLDLRRQPIYSQVIFIQLLEKHKEQVNTGRGFKGSRTIIPALYEFLQDPSLNIPGAGNFLSLVESLVDEEVRIGTRYDYFMLVNRALRLGLVSTNEIELIIKLTPRIKVGTNTLKTIDPRSLAQCYESIWDGIKTCSVFGPQDLGEELVASWLGELAVTNPHWKTLYLARDIIKTMATSKDWDCPWVPKFISQWLSLSTNSVMDSIDPCEKLHTIDIAETRREVNLQYVRSLLDLFEPSLRSKYIIQASEFLAFPMRSDAFQPMIMEAWKAVLPYITDANQLLQCREWVDIQPFPDDWPEQLHFSEHHRCLYRIWLVKMLGSSIKNEARKTGKISFYYKDDLYRTGKARVIRVLLNQFDRLSQQYQEPSDLFTNVTHCLQDLSLPYTSLMVVIARLRSRGVIPRDVWSSMKELEKGEKSLEEFFENVSQYTTYLPFLLRPFETMVRKLDVTSASFIERGIRLAESDPVHGRSMFLRLLRHHTPLQVALSKSWDHDIAAQKQRDNRIRSPGEPDPAACLELINLLAMSFACSTQMNPRISYRLVWWCYRFLYRHQAPIKPVIVRCLYHAGIVKYREQGIRVATARRDWIMNMVRKYEGDAIADALISAPPELEPRVQKTSGVRRMTSRG